MLNFTAIDRRKTETKTRCNQLLKNITLEKDQSKKYSLKFYNELKTIR